MTDKLRLEGVFTKGYGTIPKMVMQDEDLTIEAKGIYAYLCSYAGAGETAFPSVNKMCSDLGISDNRLYKHRKLLVDKGYLKIERERLDNGFSKNIYTISSTVHLQNEGVPNEPVDLQNVGIGNVDIRNVDIGNEGTNNNSSNNNRFNNNSINNNNNNSSGESEQEKENDLPQNKENLKKANNFYQSNFGVLTQHTMQDIAYWIDDIGIDLVMRALELAVEHQKNYAYAKGIMKNWEKNNIKTLEDVEAADVAFANKNNNRFKQNKPRMKEKLPEWANKKTTEIPSISADEAKNDESSNSISERLERLQRMREERELANEK